MEVSCSKCPARYAVPDAKVRGRKVRIQCKRCKAPIVVDGSSLVQTAAKAEKPAASPAASPPTPKTSDSKPGGKQLEAPPRLRMDSGWREPGAVSSPKVPGAGPGARPRSAMKRTMIGGLGGPGMDDEPETQVRPDPVPDAGPKAEALKPEPAAQPTPEPQAPSPAPPEREPEPPRQPISPAPERVASPPRPTGVGAAPRPRAAIKKTMIGIPPPAAEPALEPIAPMEPPAPEPEPPRPGTAAEWTVAITDDQHEDLTTSEVIELYVRGGVDHETFIWAEGMDDWKQPWEIPLLAAELRQRGLVPPEEGEPIVPSTDFDDDDEHTVVAQGPPFSSRPSEQSGAWREPGGWGDLPHDTEGEIGFEDVTVSMDAPHAALLLRQTSEGEVDDDDDATIDADVDALLDGAEPAGTPYAGYDQVPSAKVDAAFDDDSYDVTGRMVRPEPVAAHPAVAQGAHPPITAADIMDFHAPGASGQPHAEVPSGPHHAPPEIASQPHHAPPQAPFEYPAHGAPGMDPRFQGQQLPPTAGVSQAPAEKKGGGGGVFVVVILIILLISALAVAYVTRQPPQLWDRLPI